MTRADLDAIEATAREGDRLGKRAGADESHFSTDQDVLALVAELRAAREVVEATRAWWGDDDCAGSAPVMRDVGAALVAYDRAVTP